MLFLYHCNGLAVALPACGPQISIFARHLLIRLGAWPSNCIATSAALCGSLMFMMLARFTFGCLHDSAIRRVLTTTTFDVGNGTQGQGDAGPPSVTHR